MENLNNVDHAITALRDALKNESDPKLESILNDSNPNLNEIVNYQAAEDKSTALHLALRSRKICREARTPVANLLLKKGADEHLTDKNGNNALHMAAEVGSESLVSEFLKRGMDINALNDKKQTPLHLAVNNNHYDAINQLLSEKAAVNTQDSWGDTPLHCAVQQPTPVDSNLLLRHGANVTCRNSLGETALHLACKFSVERTVSLLLQRDKSTIDARANDGSTPLHYACMNEDLDDAVRIFKLLVKSGADVDIANRYRETAYMVAAQIEESVCKVGGHMLVTEDDIKARYQTCLLLLDKGSMDINARLSTRYRCRGTTLHIAVGDGDKKLFDLLMTRKPRLGTKNSFDQTPLWLAVGNDDMYMASVLLSRGANPNISDRDARSPLSLAVGPPGNVDMVKLLMDHNADCGERGVLHCAVKSRMPSVVHWLVQKGAKFTEMGWRVDWTKSIYSQEMLYYLLQMAIEPNMFFAAFMCRNGFDLEWSASRWERANRGVNIMIQHLALLNSQNIANVLCADMVNKDDKLKKTYEACRAELEAMRSTRVHDEYAASYHDLLTKSRNALVRTLRCERTRRALENEASYRAKFPIYADRIRLSCQEGMIQFKRMEEFCTRLQQSVRASPPREIAYKIGELVSDYDLARFVELVEIVDREPKMMRLRSGRRCRFVQ